MENNERLIETITLSQAKALVKTLAGRQSLLLLSPPGVGKSDTVVRAATEAGLPCKSLLGTQIAPEDVSGIPRIVGERSVFCPPRILLPENPEPFCLFLDELPACAPDVQKAFYSLLLERRLGEHKLPEGTWVVAAGNRMEDRALVRAMSSALVNRVTILNIRVDIKEWLIWAKGAGVRSEILAFITFMPEALMRPVPGEPVPFSTPRAWASVSEALDMAEAAGLLTPEIRRALVFGRVSAPDAAVFCAMADHRIQDIEPAREYIISPSRLPAEDTARWFVISRIRSIVQRPELRHEFEGIEPEAFNLFLMALPQEHRFATLVDLVPEWGELGADEAIIQSLREVTGL